MIAGATYRNRRAARLIGSILATLLILLFLAPVATYAAEAKETFLPPGNLTLSDDPYAVEESALPEGENTTQDVSESPRILASAVDREPEHVAESQNLARYGNAETATSTVSTPASAVPPSTKGNTIREESAVMGSALEAGAIAETASEEPAASGPSSSRDADIMTECQANQVASNIVLDDSSNKQEYDSASVTIQNGMEPIESYEPGVILVTPSNKPNLAGVQMLANRIGGVAFDASTFDEADSYFRLSITDGSSMESALKRISKVQGVISAQPNFLYRPMANREAYTSVNDRWSASQWGLYFSDVPLAWDSVRSNHSVAVAIIDTGCQMDHPDLADNIVASYNSCSSSDTVDDQIGHGTHVAGIVSGIANNSIGVAGVSYDANLVIIKASGYKDDAFDTASIARAYRWLESYDDSGMTVAQHYNVRVVNMSIGGWDDMRNSSQRDDILHTAMLKARDQYGILTITAASNKDDDDAPYFTYPGDSYACLEVMNLSEVYDDDGEFVDVELDDSSDYNVAGTAYKDLSAPGTSIHSTYTKSRYALDSGTSMAAPFVSGVAALVFAANPLLTPTQVQSILEASAMDMGDPGWDEKYGYGAVNAADAVALANTAIIKGWKAVAEWGTASFEALLGLGQGQVDGDWTWTVLGSDEDSGYATIDRSGILTGRDAGLVTVRATCHTKAGAEISQTMQVQVVDPEISGVETVGEGEVINLSTGYDDLTWTWVVEDGTGHATIDQEGHLTGVTAGTVTVRAICANNTDIVAETTVDVTAALALVA